MINRSDGGKVFRSECSRASFKRFKGQRFDLLEALHIDVQCDQLDTLPMRLLMVRAGETYARFIRFSEEPFSFFELAGFS